MQTLRKISRDRRVRRLVAGILLILILYFVGQYLYDQWLQIRDHTMEVNGWRLLIGQIGILIGLNILPFASWVNLIYLGYKVPFLTVWRIFYTTNLTKYLPGSVWAYPGRAYMYQESNVPVEQSFSAIFWEIVLNIVSAVIVAVFSVRIVLDIIPASALIGVLLLLIFGGIGVVVILQVFFHKDLRPAVFGPFIQRLQRPELRLKSWQIANIVLLYLSCWVVSGLGFAQVVLAFSPTFEPSWWIELPGVYMLGWLAGYIVLIAPGGVGVRDAVVVVAMSTLIETPLPFVVTILSRIMWTGGEVLFFGVSLVIFYTAESEDSQAVELTAPPPLDPTEET